MTRLLNPARGIAWFAILTATFQSDWSLQREAGKSLSDLGISVVANVQYGDRGRCLDLYLPRAEPASSGFPVVLLIHGGSWSGGSKSMYEGDPWRNATRLTRHGLAVIAVDYTLARPGEPSWPVALRELREAVRWTRRNAARFGLDASRVAVMGQGAGAHLAMLLGTSADETEVGDDSTKVQAVISMYGPSDLTRLSETRQPEREPGRTFVGGATPAETRERLHRASPLSSVRKSTSPMLIIHGTDDRWVPLEHSRLMADALRAYEIRTRLIEVEGARHGFETIVESPRRIDLLPEIVAFLDNVWNVVDESLHQDVTPRPKSTPDEPRNATQRPLRNSISRGSPTNPSSEKVRSPGGAD